MWQQNVFNSSICQKQTKSLCNSCAAALFVKFKWNENQKIYINKQEQLKTLEATKQINQPKRYKNHKLNNTKKNSTELKLNEKEVWSEKITP